ncbi:MAG: 3'(2'),5'-bisphosphate nucleotidase CysQ [Alphaproteobacteria bacterium]
MDYNNIITSLSSLSRKVGDYIMQVYKTDLDVYYKSDNSPFTIADKKAEELITNHIKQLTPDIPIYGEESFNNNFTPSEFFWLIDPIDGTKAFISRDNFFTINIALIKNNKPLLGVVYEPQNSELYVGSPLGAFKNDKPISVIKNNSELVIANNFASKNIALRNKFFESIKVKSFLDLTSSIKICKIAEGVADLYPRFGYTCEWDTGAGHAILKYAGGNIITIDKQELLYGKYKLLNPKFIFVYGDEKLINLIDKIKNDK